MKIRRALAASFCGTILFLLLLGGHRAALTAEHRPPSRRHPDIVLITIDTLRADALGFAGNRRAQTPVLDRLAATGRAFPNAHGHNVITLASHTNILTGLYPFEHGVRDNSGFRLGAAFPTLGTVLHAAGYATAAFIGGFPLHSRFGLARGFDVYDDRTTRVWESEGFSMRERRGDEVVAQALAWWRQPHGKARFLWVHLFDPHAPYTPPEPFATRFAGEPYSAEVAATDSFLAPLLVPFLDGREGERPFVVMTADHGEALGDHGELTHGLFAYEATLKVPLVLWGPAVNPGRDLRLARHVDIFPTILQVAGAAAPPPLPGRPFAGRSLLAEAATAAEDSYFEALSATFNRGWAPLRGTIHEGKKYVSLPLPEIYDLAADPGEKHNLLAAAPMDAAARAVLASLPRESAWPPPRGQVPPEEEAHLQSLGYLTSGGHERESFGPGDDPKTLVGLDRKMHDAMDLFSRGRLDDAIRLAREVVAERPTMQLGHWQLAQCLLGSGRTAEALAAMEEARRRGVASVPLLRNLGLTLARTGRVPEALAVLRPIAADGTPESLNALAVALSTAGRAAEAIALERRVLAVDPQNARALEQIGLAEIRLGHWGEARDQLQKAVLADPRMPVAWNNLGVALYQLQQPEPAFRAWEKAIALQPNLWDTLWNLGTKEAEHGWKREARLTLERFVAGAPRDRYADEVQQAHQFLKVLERGTAEP